MATQIIAAIRRYAPRLRGNTFLVALELAHRMNAQGLGSVSYQFLAWKAHCCRRTAITQIATLLELGLLKKTVIRTPAGYAWNLYQYIGPRVHTASPPVTTHGAKVVRTLPEAEREKERVRREDTGKTSAVRQELANQKRMLPLLYTPGTDQWHKTCEEIARLETLLACGG